MIIVGRKEEQQIISDLTLSKRPELLVVYGRRRVGKTYLIKEYFNNEFAFYSSGINDDDRETKLKMFNNSLLEYGSDDKSKLENWSDAFSRLKQLLIKTKKIDSATGKKVVFLDEVPWMDSQKSDFKPAFDFFWNTYASSDPSILFIVCGSATSWIIDNILTDTGGFYRRVTRTMKLQPFTLKECEELLNLNDVKMSRRDIALCYMIFGGIPFYINLLNRRLSLAQNINELIFKENGALHNEYDMLFSSLFKRHKMHMKLIEKIAKSNSGITRDDMIDNEIKSGYRLTKVLLELEQCGFIRKYNNYMKNTRESIYQLIDPFSLFSIKLLRKEKINDWNTFYGSPSFYSWCGRSFEVLCLNHISEIKKILNIYGVQSIDYSFNSKKRQGGCQIDLLIDRKDNIINLCEMKYTLNPFEIDLNYEKTIINKIEVFKEETKTKKTIFVTLISFSGLKKNEYSNIVVNEITGDDFFS